MTSYVQIYIISWWAVQSIYWTAVLVLMAFTDFCTQTWNTPGCPLWFSVKAVWLCVVYLCIRCQLGAVVGPGPYAGDWCGWAGGVCLGARCVSARLVPHWCGCRLHKPTPRSSCPRVGPAVAGRSASRAAAIGVGTGACIPPRGSYRCTGAGSWAGSALRVGTCAHWTRRANPEPQLSTTPKRKHKSEHQRGSEHIKDIELFLK